MESRRADVAVIGGGPAGYAAAMAAARRGASVILAEPERLGGTCVNWSCIPTNVLLAALHVSLEARELAFMGVLDAADTVNTSRLSLRRESLVRMLSGGVAVALRNAGVTVLAGRGALMPGGMAVEVGDGPVEVEAASVVVSAGARWALPDLPGIPSDRILTADLVQSMAVPPQSALVVGGGPADTAFAVEYAFLLAGLGTAVTFAAPAPLVVPALDADLDEAVTDALSTMGIDVLRNSEVVDGEPGKARVAHADGEAVVAAEAVVVADRRVPHSDGVGLEGAGVAVRDGAVVVDESCRTNVAGVLAAGDVTGGWMTTAAALHAGEVAGTVAAGVAAVTRLQAMPHVLHTAPGIAWVGRTEVAARAAGVDVATAVVDLAGNGRAVALGGRGGYLKLVADGRTGEIVGVHVVGPEAAEVVSVAATAVQAELTTADVAAMVAWHPTLTESLIDAARQLV